MRKQNELFKKIVLIILTCISAYNLLFPIFTHSQIFTQRFVPLVYEKKYNNSQYVIPQSKTPISDEELLSYAGFKYATGLNPILINSDHPPFGKYLIGWFTLLTGNNRVVSLFFGGGVIILLCSIIFFLTQSYLLTALGLFMLSVDSIFLDQLLYSPVLDIIHVFFLLLFFLFFLFWLKNKCNVLIISMGLTLGAFASTKLYFPALILLAYTTVFLLLIRKSIKLVITFFCTNLVIGFIFYMMTYTSFFLHGNSLRGFFGAQKWIFLFWKNNSINTGAYFGNMLPLILFNRWRVWWGTQKYIPFVHWTLFWPAFFSIGFIASVWFVYQYATSMRLKKNKLKQADQPELFLSLWIIIATIYLMFIPISPRYLMIIFFPMYITIALFAKRLFPKYV